MPTWCRKTRLLDQLPLLAPDGRARCAGPQKLLNSVWQDELGFRQDGQADGHERAVLPAEL